MREGGERGEGERGQKGRKGTSADSAKRESRGRRSTLCLPQQNLNSISVLRSPARESKKC